MSGTTMWWQSKTLWGAIVAMLAGTATLAGISLDASMQDQLVELIIGVANLVGGGLTWWGRVTATTKISVNVVSK